MEFLLLVNGTVATRSFHEASPSLAEIRLAMLSLIVVQL